MTDCTATLKNELTGPEALHCDFQAGHVHPEYGTDHAGPDVPPMGRTWWSDRAVGATPHTHRLPDEAAGSVGEDAGLDKSRRYLRPVRAMSISDDPAGVHLAVYSWLPVFEAWATGPGLCGESMSQGPLPDGTEVTCSRCLGWKPKYERMLAPGYRPEDDDPEVLRKRLQVALAEVAAARKFAGEMREFCSPHGVAADYADRLVEAMDRAKEGKS